MNALRFSLLALLAAALVLHLLPARGTAFPVESAIVNGELSFDDAGDRVANFLGDDASDFRNLAGSSSGAATGDEGGAKPRSAAVWLHFSQPTQSALPA
ncbi:unnamed protein product [Closterium sp. NIES-64]|nr:unnamed protein product [Closterium sp. NIES-64]